MFLLAVSLGMGVWCDVEAITVLAGCQRGKAGCRQAHWEPARCSEWHKGQLRSSQAGLDSWALQQLLLFFFPTRLHCATKLEQNCTALGPRLQLQPQEGFTWQARPGVCTSRALHCSGESHGGSRASGSSENRSVSSCR